MRVRRAATPRLTGARRAAQLRFKAIRRDVPHALLITASVHRSLGAPGFGAATAFGWLAAPLPGTHARVPPLRLPGLFR